MVITIKDLLNIPYDKAEEIITEFIKNKIEEANLKGAVIGLSGGVDSSVTLLLALKAVGPEKVTAMFMPDTRATPKRDMEDALWLVKKYGIKYYVIRIDDIVDSYSVMPFFNINYNIPTGNLRARIRMNILYYYANLHNYLVVGTGDRSEILIGYFTKFGDGGVDILPIGSLYKTQVRKMGEYLGLPERITSKPSSPALWPGHKAEEELGIKYETIDLVLYALFDKNIAQEKVPEYTGVDPSIVAKILEMHRRTRHKRQPPPTPSFPWVKEAIKEI
ncbi:NAD+ synthase [Staphylothermus hellenicus]|uniref:NH(3)-dependent NAD(+) synthetase n=1 Tax=Staphylothermus hellenicus (strain DSM 12710 / JCM 10830 / BK20S6-10-b1 / P8) TaxID=591019 RepID=D7D8Z4_STAHD|nr:NAD+ synthase [Staphylothermus hellenicus]ADI32240.1 NAD+ synthetase [Staphylothermus hellenicus DSM 12710]